MSKRNGKIDNTRMLYIFTLLQTIPPAAFCSTVDYKDPLTLIGLRESVRNSILTSIAVVGHCRTEWLSFAPSPELLLPLTQPGPHHDTMPNSERRLSLRRIQTLYIVGLNRPDAESGMIFPVKLRSQI